MSRLLLVVLLTITLLNGCDTAPKMNYAAANLVKAGGTVTLDGKPLPNAVVTFESPVDGTNANGLTGADGRYVLMFDSQMAGVMPGKKIVRISTTKKILGLNAKEGEEASESDAAGGPRVELVPDKFNRKTELTVEVTPDKTDYNFDLTSEEAARP